MWLTGSQGRSKALMQVAQDGNAASVNQEIAVKRAVSKSSGMYKNKKWDLVDAAEDSEFDYEALKEEELPAELKGKSTSEVKAYVAKKIQRAG